MSVILETKMAFHRQLNNNTLTGINKAIDFGLPFSHTKK